MACQLVCSVYTQNSVALYFVCVSSFRCSAPSVSIVHICRHQMSSVNQEEVRLMTSQTPQKQWSCAPLGGSQARHHQRVRGQSSLQRDLGQPHRKLRCGNDYQHSSQFSISRHIASCMASALRRCSNVASADIVSRLSHCAFLPLIPFYGYAREERLQGVALTSNLPSTAWTTWFGVTASPRRRGRPAMLLLCRALATKPEYLLIAF